MVVGSRVTSLAYVKGKGDGWMDGWLATDRPTDRPIGMKEWVTRYRYRGLWLVWARTVTVRWDAMGCDGMGWDGMGIQEIVGRGMWDTKGFCTCVRVCLHHYTVPTISMGFAVAVLSMVRCVIYRQVR